MYYTFCDKVLYDFKDVPLAHSSGGVTSDACFVLWLGRVLRQNFPTTT